MDIVSHGLWGGAAFGRSSRRSFWVAFLSGIGPDLFSFGIFFISVFLGLHERPDFSSGPPDPSFIPAYVHYLYQWTHSLVIFSLAFLLLWFLYRRPVWEFSAWGLHILFDIPTHSTAFFPTPFLWPLSDIKVSGIPWSSAVIFIPNVLLLSILYGRFFVWPRIRRRFRRAG